MAGPLQLYFDVWPASSPHAGAASGELTRAYEKKLVDVLGDTGAGSFVINRHDAQAAWCEAGALVRVRSVAGGPFAWNSANYKFAFYIEDSSDAMVDPNEEAGDEWHRGGRGIMSVFERLVWWSTNFTGSAGPRADGYWYWVNDQFGDILLRLISEWNARPSNKPKPPTLTATFTSTQDSDGNLWPTFNGTHKIQVGTDYLASVLELESQGIEVRMRPDFTVDAYNALGQGADKSATVAFREGWNIRTAGDRQIYAPKRATRALVRGGNTDQAVLVEVTDGLTTTDEAGKWGRREILVERANSSDTAPLTRIGEQALARLRLLDEGPIQIGVTSYGKGSDLASPPARQDWLPYTDYEVGDKVTLGIPGEYEDVAKRIIAIFIDEAANGEAEVGIGFGAEPFSGVQAAGKAYSNPVGGGSFIPGPGGVGDPSDFPEATYGEISGADLGDNYTIQNLEVAAGGSWNAMAANLEAPSGCDYNTYDYDADAVCGATVQLRDPHQAFAATLLRWTGIVGTPVRARIRLEWYREEPPLGPRPDANKWMPHIVTVQPRSSDSAPPGSTAYQGAVVGVIDNSAESGTFEFYCPVYGSGSTRRIFVVIRPLWELASAAVCGHPADYGLMKVKALSSGGNEAKLEGLATAGWAELAPLGTFDGLTVTFTLAGDVADVEWITKNGLVLPEDAWNVDLVNNTITFTTPPRANDLVIVRYRMVTVP